MKILYQRWDYEKLAASGEQEASKVKTSGSEKKNEQEHKQQNLWYDTFFHKMCN